MSARTASLMSTNEIQATTRMVQHRYLTTALGGLVSKAVPMQEIQTVLDVGCGTGDWSLDMLRRYSRIRVTGIDSHEDVLRDATRAAYFSGLSNVTFLQRDATKPLSFKNGTFDLVHLCVAAPFLQLAPGVIPELVRVLRPGGWLNLVAFEHGATSSTAFNRLVQLAMKATHTRRPGTTSSGSPNIGAAPQLYGLLLNAYLLDVSYTVHAVDLGASSTLDAKDFLEEMLKTFSNCKPFICRLNLAQPSEYDALVAQSREDLAQPDACGYAYLVSAVGRKDG